MNKGFCAKTDLCPLASPRVALVGLRAATRGCPLPNHQRNIGDGPVSITAPRLGWGGVGIIVYHRGVAMLYKPSYRNGTQPQHHKYPRDAFEA